MRSTLSDVIRRRPLPSFFVLAYALSWCAVPWVGPKLLPWGPALAAVIILAMTEGKTGLKDLVSQTGRWRVGFKWYAIAMSIPLIYGLIAAGLFGATMGELDPWTSLLLLVSILLLGGQWEEPGWTGYALPRLLEGRSALVASLILSILRLGWHFPLLLYGEIPLADLVFIVAMQFVVTWMYSSTRSSVLIVMVLHFMQNVGGAFFNPAFSGDDAVGYAWLRAAVYAAIAMGLIVWAWGGTCHEDPRQSRGSGLSAPGSRHRWNAGRVVCHHPLHRNIRCTKPRP